MGRQEDKCPSDMDWERMEDFQVGGILICGRISFLVLFVLQLIGWGLPTLRQSALLKSMNYQAYPEISSWTHMEQYFTKRLNVPLLIKLTYNVNYHSLSIYYWIFKNKLNLKSNPLRIIFNLALALFIYFPFYFEYKDVCVLMSIIPSSVMKFVSIHWFLHLYSLNSVIL